MLHFTILINTALLQVNLLLTTRSCHIRAASAPFKKNRIRQRRVDDEEWSITVSNFLPGITVNKSNVVPFVAPLHEPHTGLGHHVLKCANYHRFLLWICQKEEKKKNFHSSKFENAVHQTDCSFHWLIDWLNFFWELTVATADGVRHETVWPQLAPGHDGILGQDRKTVLRKSEKKASVWRISMFFVNEWMNELNWWSPRPFPQKPPFYPPLDVTLEDPLRGVVPVVQVILVHIVADQVSPVLKKKEKRKRKNFSGKTSSLSANNSRSVSDLSIQHIFQGLFQCVTPRQSVSKYVVMNECVWDCGLTRRNTAKWRKHHRPAVRIFWIFSMGPGEKKPKDNGAPRVRFSFCLSWCSVMFGLVIALTHSSWKTPGPAMFDPSPRFFTQKSLQSPVLKSFANKIFDSLSKIDVIWSFFNSLTCCGLFCWSRTVVKTLTGRGSAGLNLAFPKRLPVGEIW